MGASLGEADLVHGLGDPDAGSGVAQERPGVADVVAVDAEQLPHLPGRLFTFACLCPRQPIYFASGRDAMVLRQDGIRVGRLWSAPVQEGAEIGETAVAACATVSPGRCTRQRETYQT